jgi:hypothetical protein
MEKIMVRNSILVCFSLFANGAFAAESAGAAAQTKLSLLYAYVGEVMFVLEMVKLPIVLPILP